MTAPRNLGRGQILSRLGRLAVSTMALVTATTLGVVVDTALVTPTHAAYAEGPSSTGGCNYDSLIEGDAVNGTTLTAASSYWKLDSATLGTDTLNADAGTVTGTVTSGVTPGPLLCDAADAAATFDGSTGFIQTATSTGNPSPKVFTIAAWFKTSSAGVGIVGGCSSTTADGCTSTANTGDMLYVDTSGDLNFQLTTTAASDIVDSATTVDNGQWHLAVAMQASSATLTCGATTAVSEVLYLDGTCVGSVATHQTPSAATSWFWRIGQTPGTGFVKEGSCNATNTKECAFFNGQIGRVAVWNTTDAFSTPTMATAYGEAVGASCDYDSLVGSTITGYKAFGASSYWKMDGATVGTDSNGSDTATANGTVTTGVTPGPLTCDSADGAATFDGSTGYLSTATSTGSSGPAVFAIAAWFKTSSPGGGIVGGCNTTTANGCSASSKTGDMLYVNSNGDLSFQLTTTAASGIVDTAATVDNGQWHFAVAMQASSATLTCGSTNAVSEVLYLDGTCVGSVATHQTPTSVTSWYWRIGQTPGTGYANEGSCNTTNVDECAFFNGQIGRVAVWNTATVTPAQVDALYGAAALGTLSATNWYVATGGSPQGTLTYTWTFTLASSASLTSIALGVPTGTVAASPTFAFTGLSATGASAAVSGTTLTVTFGSAQPVDNGTVVTLAIGGLMSTPGAASTTTVTTINANGGGVTIAPGGNVDAATAYGSVVVPDSATFSNACTTTPVNCTVATSGATQLTLIAIPGAASPTTASVVLSATTNAAGGYKLQAEASPLTATIGTHTYTLAEASTGGVGAVPTNAFYATAALTSSGGPGAALCSPYSSATPDVGYSTSAPVSIWHDTADSPTTSGVDSVTLTDSVQVSKTQPAGVYTGTITYSITSAYTGGGEAC